MPAFIYRTPFAAILLSSTTSLSAQEATGDAPAAVPVAANGAQRYTPADFTRFAPRTALDMVEKVPGFLIVTGTNGGERGLGAATENVLIDGERIANKSTDARTALARITAAEVAYIDIVDGAGLNVPGLTGQVANVVLVAGAASDGFKTTPRWQPEWRRRLDDNWLNGEISTTGKIGGTNRDAEPEERSAAPGDIGGPNSGLTAMATCSSCATNSAVTTPTSRACPPRSRGRPRTATSGTSTLAAS